MNKRIILAGGSGYLGRHLAEHFAHTGYAVVILSRRTARDEGNIRTVCWDGRSQGHWSNELEGAHAVINLTGRSVDCRYDQTNKDLILSSRLNATQAVAEAIASCTSPPAVWVNAASATIYTDTRGEAPANDETNGVIGEGFSVEVCKAWEACFNENALPNTRKLCLRVAIVISRDGGAMVPILRLAKLGLGGKMGGGDQYISWIHAEDFVRSIQFLIDHEEIDGTVNIVSPDARPNAEFMAVLRKHCGRPIGLPTPAALLALGARVIQTETELILKSRHVAPGRLRDAGFEWSYPTLEAAFTEICGSSVRRKTA